MYSFVTLLSLSIIVLRFTHVTACIQLPSLFTAELCSIVCHNLFIHSPDDGHLSCFQIFAVIALFCFILYSFILAIFLL